MHDRRARKVALAGVAIGVTFVGVLLAWVGREARRAAEAARASDCRSQLKQLGLALMNYHSDFGCFPPAHISDEKGMPIRSWRVAYLPIWKEHELHDRYDFTVPWDHPKNAGLLTLDTPAFFYWCPSGDGRKTRHTNYVAVVDPHTAWPGGRGRRLQEVADHPSQTILVIEVAESGIHWMEPRDLTLQEILSRGPSSHHPRHFNALFADGNVHRVRKDISRQVLKALLTVDGGEVINPESWQSSGPERGCW